MKALITAVALLSFVAASTVPLAARAETHAEQTHKAKKSHKAASHKSTHKSAKGKSKKKSHAAA